MRDLAILTFVTLDGVMQAPSDPSEDTSGDFQLAGWARPYWDDVMAQVGRTAMAAPYDLLIGRTTYGIFKGAHSSTDENDPLLKARKYIVTSSKDSLKWPNSIRISGDVAAEIAKLKTTDGPLLQVHGSWRLIQLLLAHDLIDEFRLWVFPVTLGAGKRLFAEGAPPAKLRLTHSEPTGNGVFMMTYRRAD